MPAFTPSAVLRAASAASLALAALSFVPAAQAATFTLDFKASGFTNIGGNVFPGFDGPVEGSVSWESLGVSDTISALTAIDFVLFGHRFSLSDVGIASQTADSLVLGAAPNGFNTVVGNGVATDFLIVLDRRLPGINSFGYGLAGKDNALWISPSFTEASYRTGTVPEPAILALALLALGGVVAGRWKRS